jgi:Tfp pilus assembly protein FimT
MRARFGYTVIELLAVVLLAGIVAGTAMPRMAHAMAGNRVQRAAAVVTTDLQLAHSMAARQRRPVLIEVDTVAQLVRVRDLSTSSTIFSQRFLGTNSEFGVGRLTASPLQVIVYPTGVANSNIDITLRAGDQVRQVRMTRAGQVRTTAP